MLESLSSPVLPARRSWFALNSIFGVVDEARGRQRHRRRVWLLATAATFAAALATAGWQLSSQPSQEHGRSAVSVASARCDSRIVMRIPKGTSPLDARAVATLFSRRVTTRYGSMRSAAKAAGGCVSATLTPSYTPDATPTEYGDIRTGSTNVKVGSDQGFVTYLRGSGKSLELQLTVLLPQPGHRMRDLDIGALGLSEAALVRIAAKGLL